MRTGSDVDVRPFPSRAISQIAAWALGIASLFSLVSALWQHVAASAAAFVVDATTQGRLVAAAGTTAMALGWAVFALIAITMLMLIMMITSISLLDRLTNEDQRIGQTGQRWNL